VSNTRLPDHELWSEGHAIESRNQPRRPREGRGECSCGELSPVLPSTAQRKQWHRDHKHDLANGGNGVVWRGSGVSSRPEGQTP
jgi:hypothetical protein